MINKFSFVLCIVLSALSVAAPSTATGYKIAYLEAGPYFTYSETFNIIKDELHILGWDKKIDFPQDAHFSPGWEPKIKKEILPLKAQELMARGDLDLIIAAGTSGNRAILEANNGKTPILGMCVSDAVKAGFVTNEYDSGKDNYTVRIVPGRYKRMFKLFHDVVGFKKLGLLYHDQNSRNSAANADDAHEIAKEAGFQIVEHRIDDMSDTAQCLDGLKALSGKGMDAFFIPSLTCFDWKVTPGVDQLFDYLNNNKIPSFARQGTKDVQAGALMGFSSINFSDRGKHLTKKIIKILQGAKPRDLSMVDEVLPQISFNLAVANKIDFEPPIDILAITDEVFPEIKLPEDRKMVTPVPQN